MTYFLALVASLSIGLADFYAGVLSKRLTVYAVFGGSAVVAALAFFTVGVITKTMHFDEVDLVAGSVAGILFLVGNLMYFTALTRGNMGVVSGTVTLLVLVPLITDMRQGQMPSPLNLLGIAVIMGGVIMLGIPEMKGSKAMGPVLLAFIAALFLGAAEVSLDLGSKENVLASLITMQIVGVVIISVIALATRSRGGFTFRETPAIVVIGMLNAIAVSAFSYATTSGNLAIVSVLSSLDSLVVLVMAFFFLKQNLARVQKFAFIVVLLGTFLVSFQPAN
jgi:drug/metabolite transporter (DMT)-like permease